MDFLAKALVPFFVFFVFALARRYLPATSIEKREYRYTLEELDARFSTTQWVVNSVMVAIGVVFALGAHAALVTLNRYCAFADSSAPFLIWPSSAIWWFFPGFGAVTLSWGITLELWGGFGRREDADLFAHWTSLKAGFDSTKILHWFGILLVLPIGILTLLALPIHTALRPEGIRYCGYAFRSCKLTRYEDARRLTIVDGFRNSHGEFIQSAGIVIDFNDGHRWSSAINDDPQENLDPALKDFVESRTGLPYNHAQTEADISALTSGIERGSQ